MRAAPELWRVDRPANAFQARLRQGTGPWCAFERQARASQRLRLALNRRPEVSRQPARQLALGKAQAAASPISRGDLGPDSGNGCQRNRAENLPGIAVETKPSRSAAAVIEHKPLSAGSKRFNRLLHGRPSVRLVVSLTSSFRWPNETNCDIDQVDLSAGDVPHARDRDRERPVSVAKSCVAGYPGPPANQSAISGLVAARVIGRGIPWSN